MADSFGKICIFTAQNRMLYEKDLSYSITIIFYMLLFCYWKWFYFCTKICLKKEVLNGFIKV